MADRFRQLGLGDEDVAAWRASGMPADALDDWLTDRVARRPSGTRARDVYGADDVHDFARRAILEALDLRADDRLLEIGCGGGILLRAALESGATVTGIDHSEEMARLAADRAPGAEVVVGTADNLPFDDGTFTAVAMSMVFLFLPEPIRVLTECRRVLERRGRMSIYTAGPSLRGTPAAPEPIASRAHFYGDEELRELVRSAGFDDVIVTGDDGGQLVRARA